MAVDKYIIQYIQNKFSLTITDIKIVNGGSINNAYCLFVGASKYFIKINNDVLFPGMFSAEAYGLTLISNTGAIAVPKVLFTGQLNSNSFLLSEWIDSKPPSIQSSALLGRQLAQMHKFSSDYFGMDSDNYVGSLRQSNKRHLTWSDFFICERLQPMVKMAVDKQYLNAKDSANFEILYKNLPGLFSEEPPALVHGDLWGGNYLISRHGVPYLIDPAVSFGNREFDIAMTTLFGGFSQEFYLAYNDQFPLQKEWAQRVDLWNLYPLLVHLNLFGEGYLAQVRGCLKQYI